jgi:integrase/recombinase XerD
MKLPVLRDRLAERILSEAEVQRMIALERHTRNQALLYLLYASGVRVSECCGLKWRDVQERSDGGQITVLGKGGKTNTILLPASLLHCLMAIKGDSGAEEPIFRSRKGRHLHPTQVRRVVRQAAKRAGIDKAISPHWMRHAHASHALDRGAPIHLVQATLGHASVATTGRYLHARPSESSSAYLRIAAGAAHRLGRKTSSDGRGSLLIPSLPFQSRRWNQVNDTGLCNDEVARHPIENPRATWTIASCH